MSSSSGSSATTSTQAVATTAANLPSPTLASNTPPHDLVVDFFPKANPETLPPGVDASVRWDGYLTLTTTCLDDEGDQLLCRWTCDDGILSSDSEVEMQWEGTDRVWKGVWIWQPPPGAPADAVYTLTCEIVDGNGGSVNGQIGTSGQAIVLPRGRVCFTSDWNGDQDIYIVNADGTDLTKLTKNNDVDTGASWFPDGQKIAYLSNEDQVGGAAYGGGAESIWTMNNDGTERHKLFDSTAFGLRWVNSIAVSPDGNQIAFVGQSSSLDMDLYLINADGTDPDSPGVPGVKELTNQNWAGMGGGARGVCWSPDGARILFGGGVLSDATHPTGTPGLAEDLYEYDVVGDSLLNLTNSPGSVVREPSLSPDGTELLLTVHGADNGGVLQSYTDGTGEMVTMNKDGTLPRVLLRGDAGGPLGPQTNREFSWLVY